MGGWHWPHDTVQMSPLPSPGMELWKENEDTEPTVTSAGGLESHYTPPATWLAVLGTVRAAACRQAPSFKVLTVNYVTLGNHWVPPTNSVVGPVLPSCPKPVWFYDRDRGWGHPSQPSTEGDSWSWAGQGDITGQPGATFPVGLLVLLCVLFLKSWPTLSLTQEWPRITSVKIVGFSHWHFKCAENDLFF